VALWSSPAAWLPRGDGLLARRLNRIVTPYRKETPMYFHFSLGPLVALIAGVLILIIPRLLNYIVAIYLILIGIIGLLAHGTAI
jgi:hypothetical protein